MNVDLYFLGERDYVNGLTIVEEVCDPAPPDRILAVRFRAFLRGHARVSFVHKTTPTGSECARLDLDYGHMEVNALVFERLEAPPPPRIPDYDRRQYFESQEQEGPGGRVSAKLRSLTDSRDLLRALVELMQQATDSELTCPQKSYWAWMKNYTVLPPPNVSRIKAVTLTPSRKVMYKGKTFFVRNAQVEGIACPVEFGYFSQEQS